MNQTGKYIQKFRKQKFTKEGKSLSQLDLSLLIGWENPSTLSRIESGEVIPTRSTIIKICKALDLNYFDSNYLLESAGYSSRLLPVTKQYTKELVLKMQQDFQDISYPVLVLNIEGEIIYWNKAVERIIFNNLSSNNPIPKIGKITYIDLIFNPVYSLKQYILNWTEASTIAVSSTKYLIGLYPNNKNLKANLARWLKYKEFKNIWDISIQQNSEYIQYYNKRLILKHPLIGKIEMLTQISPTHIDNRFYLEQFIPNSMEDKLIIERFLNEDIKK